MGSGGSENRTPQPLMDPGLRGNDSLIRLEHPLSLTVMKIMDSADVRNVWHARFLGFAFWCFWVHATTGLTSAGERFIREKLLHFFESFRNPITLDGSGGRRFRVSLKNGTPHTGEHECSFIKLQTHLTI
jgi:hypothetical protein